MSQAIQLLVLLIDLLVQLTQIPLERLQVLAMPTARLSCQVMLELFI